MKGGCQRGGQVGWVHVHGGRMACIGNKRAREVIQGCGPTEQQGSICKWGAGPVACSEGVRLTSCTAQVEAMRMNSCMSCRHPALPPPPHTHTCTALVAELSDLPRPALLCLVSVLLPQEDLLCGGAWGLGAVPAVPRTASCYAQLPHGVGSWNPADAAHNSCPQLGAEEGQVRPSRNMLQPNRRGVLSMILRINNKHDSCRQSSHLQTVSAGCRAQLKRQAAHTAAFSWHHRAPAPAPAPASLGS